MRHCWVSIGSNQDRERCIRGSVHALRERFGGLILSSVYESAAVGVAGEPYFNLVAGFGTTESVSRLLATLRSIEDSFGRVRGTEKFSSRTLDLDLLTYGGLTGSFDGYKLPRDDILRYAFVLCPLAEIAGDEIHPCVARSYRQLWEAFDREAQQLVPVAFDFGDCDHHPPPAALADR
ncbi:MAG: 2-amino-4-hydroxy-6-hydroxymethyldihydropteridine diphosphokinase [Chromatiaceae bacterium]|jgi:2-amino-4-hydroxy-6-hydroxymethyldihydropteridine diphosphokinase|nr:2-amino-4-hydroxy-6-hydroxymethyldihydropteridine diphosphokinase [Chromatiaceae bacterium]